MSGQFLKKTLLKLHLSFLYVWIVHTEEHGVCPTSRLSSASAAWQCWWFQMSIKLHCFFNLGLKRRVWNALSTTLGRWIGFLCSRSLLLVDPLGFFLFRTLSLAQTWTSFCLESSATRGTRKTQLEWRSCSVELEATVAERSGEQQPELKLKTNSFHSWFVT